MADLAKELAEAQAKVERLRKKTKRAALKAAATRRAAAHVVSESSDTEQHFDEPNYDPVDRPVGGDDRVDL